MTTPNPMGAMTSPASTESTGPEGLDLRSEAEGAAAGAAAAAVCTPGEDVDLFWFLGAGEGSPASRSSRRLPNHFTTSPPLRARPGRTRPRDLCSHGTCRSSSTQD